MNWNAAIRNFIYCISITILSSCTLKNDQKTFSEKRDLTPYFTTGEWQIKEFKKDKVEKHDLYRSYHFKFLDNNTIDINTGVKHFSGQWSVVSVDNEDDAPDSDIAFVVSLGSAAKLAAVTGSWNIISHTKTTLELYRASSSQKGMDVLIFSKL